jgi:dolichol-phosphate mannosyltransferase
MLSIVVPVFNEADSLTRLHAELSAVGQQHGYELDVIYVSDGSTDGSWNVIDRLCELDQRVRGIRLRRNFGKAAALSAGIQAARGDLVVTLDADLQDDPAEIPRFLAAMEKFDVVSGWKKQRHDPWHKVWPSRIFNRLVSRLTGVYLHDHNCGFKCYRREIFRELRLYGELHRFVPVLAAARGWTVGEVVVNHRERRFGKSKYGLWRIPKGFLDLLTVKFLTGFGQRPQHVLGTVGLLAFTAGSIGIAILTAMWVLSRSTLFSQALGLEPVHLTQRAVFFYCLGATLLGAQFMLAGFLAEMMTALHARDTESYSVAERIGGTAGAKTNDESAAGLQEANGTVPATVGLHSHVRSRQPEAPNVSNS